MATIPASSFGHWLRTGRLPAVRVASERKFNPWHDPDTGQFTFGPADGAMAKKPQPFGGYGGGDSGGGGSSGMWDGGGASGSWDGPAPAKPRSKPAPKPTPKPAPQFLPVAAPAAPGPASNPLISSNGYGFAQDNGARTSEVSGELRAGTSPRSRRAQLGAGGADRLAGDDGGHYIATRFNGPRDAFNHFAQDRNFNRGAYRAMEDEWARLIAKGKKVHVKITPRYEGGSRRPFLIRVKWTVDGVLHRRRFLNRKGGK